MKIDALTAVVFLLITAGPAHAGTIIASPAIYGGPVEVVAECDIRNVGKTTLTIGTSTKVTIRDGSGNALTIFSQSCNGANQTPGEVCHLTSGASFEIEAQISGGVAYACTASGSVTNLRGVIYVGPPSSDVGVWRSAELR
jgi:hypothetical protein